MWRCRAAASARSQPSQLPMRSHAPASPCHATPSLPAPPGLLLAAASFGLLTAVLALELNGRYVVTRRWLLSCPMVLVAASELVKLRFVVQLELEGEGAGGGSGTGRFGYFFGLYVCYVGLQVCMCWLVGCLCGWRHQCAHTSTHVLLAGVDAHAHAHMRPTPRRPAAQQAPACSTAPEAAKRCPCAFRRSGWLPCWRPATHLHAHPLPPCP